MTYGTIKVDTVTFTNAGVDKSITLSGLVQNPTFSGNVTVTGTLSGVTVTGTTANFTSGNFTNISGGTHTITSGVFAAGSAASPSITFTGDLNTGIYSPGADQVAISTGGSGRLFVDASGRVGVGSASPSALLSVASTTTSYTAESFNIGEPSLSTGRQLYMGYNTADGVGFIQPVHWGTEFKPLVLCPNGGRVGIGTTSLTDAQLYVNSSSIYGVRINHATLPLQSFLVNGTQAFTIGANSGGGGSFYYGTGDLEAARIDSSGRLLVGTSSQSGGALLQVNGDRVRIATAKTPASATDTGTAGEICWDASYVYVCTATNTWKRSALSTW